MSFIERVFNTRLPFAVVILEAFLLFFLIAIPLPYLIGKMHFENFLIKSIPMILFATLFVFYCRVMVSREKR